MAVYEKDDATGESRADADMEGAAYGNPAHAMAADNMIAITPISEETKVCPFCVERVPISAVKCRYCGSALTKC